MSGYATNQELARACAINLLSAVPSRERLLRDVFFKPRVGAIESAYNDLFGAFVMLREASLPDVCIVCGSSACGNVYRAKYEPYRYPSWHVPIFYDIAYSVLGKRYFVDFPFCSICKSEDFGIQATQINENIGVFSGVSKTFLKLLPIIPPDVAAELEGTWPQRALRFIGRF
jgi:hypothetical protein